MMKGEAEARAEIALLKEAIRRLAEQDATLSVCNGNVTVTMDATLTDEERELLARLGSDTREWDKFSNGRPWFVRVEDAAILRGLLARLG